MSRSRVTVLGAYRIDVTDELFGRAMALKFPGDFESQDERLEAERAVRDEMGGAVLFEVAVDDLDSQFSMDRFGQDGSDQAPYDETFLSEDGRSVVSCGFEVPSGGRLRVAFFLHFVNPSIPLMTPYGSIPIPSIESMPERLRRLVPYEPVD